MEVGLGREGSRMVNEEDDDGFVDLPPGFRFHPTDEEIIMHYLLQKIMDRRFAARAIGEADLNKCEPWDLPKKAKMGEREWFFFCQRDRKYPTGIRTNRATESGFWKATGKDKEIYRGRNVVGMKKTLVFYKGRAPKGHKTNWVMHEFRLHGNYNFSTSPAKEDFVVCRVCHKNSGLRRSPGEESELSRIDSLVDHDMPAESPTPLTDYNCLNENHEQESKATRVYLENHKVQMQYDERNMFVPPPNIPFLVPHSFPDHQQDGLIPSYYHQTRAEDCDGPNLRPKMEHYFSYNNSMMSHSRDTDEISWKKTAFDGDDQGLGFSPNISDLDSLWRY